MADELLSQAELETLLSNVAAGTAPKISNSPHHAVPAPHATAFHEVPAAQPRPLSNRVDPQQLAMLRARHESFGRKLSAALSAWLRLVVEVRLQAVDDRTLGEMLDAVDKPTFCQVLRAAPLDQRCVVNLPLEILYIILDRLLGGGREPAVVVRRPPTEIELRLASRITGLILAELRTAWHGMLDLELSAERVETDARWLGDPTRNEPMLVFSFDVKLSDTRGMMLLAIPLTALHRVGQAPIETRSDASVLPLRATAAANPGSTATPPGDKSHRSAKPAANQPVELAVCLAETTITARDLQLLQPGDIIATEQPADGLIGVYQDGVLKYYAQLGSYQGQKAIQIEKIVEAPIESEMPG